MTVFGDLELRNEAFAADFDGGDLPIKGRLPFVILSCIDPRTSPVHFFGLDIGDALVMRTVGGRVTDSVEAELRILWFLTKRTAGHEPGLSMAVVHHTDCGMQKISDDESKAALTEYMGSDHFGSIYPAPDPEASVRFDVERLRASTVVPEGLRINGYVYDVGTGRLRQILDG